MSNEAFFWPRGQASLRQGTHQSSKKSLGCMSCGLSQGAIHPHMKPNGLGRKRVLFLGEAPGATEDEEGVQFVGRAGSMLRKACALVDVDLNRDCWTYNAVNCRPPDNRPPTPKEILICRTKVLKTIQELKPKVVVLLGSAAIHSVIGNYWKKRIGELTKWRGFAIPSAELGCYLCPTFHPSYVLRDENISGTAGMFFVKDIKRALSCLEKEKPAALNPVIDVEFNPNKARKKLLAFMERRSTQVAFDYETTGLKPHRKGHRVVCISLSDIASTLCFKFHEDLRQLWMEFLRSSVPKVASNMKFEETWSRVFFQTRVKNWHWDTMLASHILDNRKDITSIKFQAYVRYGLADYDSDISPFLQGEEENNANAFNRIHEIESNSKLLTYCGWDSYLEALVAKDQQRELQTH